MKRILFVILFVAVGTPPASAGGLELSGSQITVGEGLVTGAAFYEQRELLFVQQEIYIPPAVATQRGRTQRQISSWGLKSHSMLRQRRFEPESWEFPGCGRVEVSSKTNRILLCSADSYLEELDPDTLRTVGRIASGNDQYIYDFAVDEARGRVYVLSVHGKGFPLSVASYSLVDGFQLQEAVLPPTTGTKIKLGINLKDGQVAVAVDHNDSRREKTDIYVCESRAALDCTSVAVVPRLLNIDLLGRELLGATDASADHKKECLIGVDLGTHSVSHEYCCPSTGVHWALGVAGGNYIVAFTGTARRVWWREESTSHESSFSVWRVEDPQVAAVAKEPANFGSRQFGASIFVSRKEPWFVAHVGDSNVLYVYSIRERSE
jgi:hypothetical protein